MRLSLVSPTRPNWRWRPVVGGFAAFVVLCTPAMSTAAQVPPAPAESRPTPTPSQERFAGAVVERVEAGSYTYLRVRRDSSDGLVWVVAMGKGLPVGARVTVAAFGEQKDFLSRRTGRRFDRLVFGTVTPHTSTPTTGARP